MKMAMRRMMMTFLFSSQLGAAVQCLCRLCSCVFYSYRVPCFDTCESDVVHPERALDWGVPRCRDYGLNSTRHTALTLLGGIECEFSAPTIYYYFYFLNLFCEEGFIDACTWWARKIERTNSLLLPKAVDFRLDVLLANWHFLARNRVSRGFKTVVRRIYPGSFAHADLPRTLIYIR